MSTVSAMHQNKPGRKKSSVGKNPKSLADFKTEIKKSKKKDNRRDTTIPTYQDVTDSNLANAELQNNQRFLYEQ